MQHYFPLVSGVICASLVVIARLLTNYYIRKRAFEALMRGSAVGLIPQWVSAIYVLSFIGLGISCIWAFVSVAWWAGTIVVLLYVLTEFVRSAAARLAALKKKGAAPLDAKKRSDTELVGE